MDLSDSFLGYAACLREFMHACEGWVALRGSQSSAAVGPCYKPFEALALELFALQYAHNSPYRRLCEARGISPKTLGRWEEIPAVPAAAFKELELTCFLPENRTKIFHSSGTTAHRPSRHFHNSESLEIYEASCWNWFALNVASEGRLVILTPPAEEAPNSSLVHMFETVRRKMRADRSVFVGRAEMDGAWQLDVGRAIDALKCNRPTILLGTAFSLVHLLDYLGEQALSIKLPAGSRVMETGGYKGRSRSLPKLELHRLISRRLGVPASEIVCEYGMSELSSQAYDKLEMGEGRALNRGGTRCFHFPPWARVQIVSPETGVEVEVGETGLLRVFDLANIYSAMAIQTEDLGVKHEEGGFDLIGRAERAEARGCSLMARQD